VRNAAQPNRRSGNRESDDYPVVFMKLDATECIHLVWNNRVERARVLRNECNNDRVSQSRRGQAIHESLEHFRHFPRVHRVTVPSVAESSPPCVGRTLSSQEQKPDPCARPTECSCYTWVKRCVENIRTVSLLVNSTTRKYRSAFVLRFMYFAKRFLSLYHSRNGLE
jgi:hypothetical protein